MAEIKDILETNDFTVHIEIDYALTNNLTESSIDAALVYSGNPNPKIRDVGFFLTDLDKTFRITWLQNTGKYVYLKQKTAL